MKPRPPFQKALRDTDGKQNVIDPHVVLDSTEIMELAGRVHQKMRETSEVVTPPVLAVQALGVADRAGAADVRRAVIENLSNYLVMFDDVAADAIMVSDALEQLA